jgi:hypothetical protein
MCNFSASHYIPRRDDRTDKLYLSDNMMNDLHMRRQLAHSLRAEAILERANLFNLFAVARWVRATAGSILFSLNLSMTASLSSVGV